MADDTHVPPLTATLSLLEKQRGELERKLQLIKETIENMKRLVGDTPMPAPASQEFTGLGIAEAAKRWFFKAQLAQASTREIADALLANGISTTSKNFTMTVYTILHGNPRFKRTAEGQWTYVKDLPVPPPPTPATAAKPAGRLVKRGSKA